MGMTKQGRSGAGLPCPVCRVDLVMSERQGVEIDYCPKCRGVWLDRGELDKIIERSAERDSPPLSVLPAPGQPAGGWTQRPPPPLPSPGGHGRDQGYVHRRKSWLQELFD